MQVQGKRVVYWLEGEPQQNFGDFLTEYLVEGLVHRMLGSADAYRLIGSVISDWNIQEELEAANASERGKVAFWACGAREDRPLSPGELARAEFYGVRGPLTRQLLGLPPEVALGDPAFLLPLFHVRRTSPLTTGKRICVPHFLDRKSDQALLAETGADLVLRPAIGNSLAALKEIIDQIASAEFVLAGSLHAAIVACAYDRPFAFLDAGHVDIPFKWRDFAASIGVSPLFVGNVTDGQSIYSLFMQNRIVKPALFPLLASGPFVAKLPMLLAAARSDSSAPMNDQTFAGLMRSLDQLLDRYELAELRQRGNAALDEQIIDARSQADALGAAREEAEMLKSALAHAEATLRGHGERFTLHETALRESNEHLTTTRAQLADSEVALQERTSLLDRSRQQLADGEDEIRRLQAAVRTARAEVVRQKEKRLSRRLKRLFQRSKG